MTTQAYPRSTGTELALVSMAIYPNNNYYATMDYDDADLPNMCTENSVYTGYQADSTLGITINDLCFNVICSCKIYRSDRSIEIRARHTSLPRYTVLVSLYYTYIYMCLIYMCILASILLHITRHVQSGIY